MDTGTPRKIDTRKGPMITAQIRKSTKWAAEHQKTPPAKWVLAPEAAVEKVVALEAKNPKLIPEPFREKLLANPKDAALRLEIGACEAKRSATRRRAAYEGAMALLLGAPPEEAQKLIMLGTHGEDTTHSTSFCGEGKSPCAEGSYCDVEYGECIGRDEHVHTYISEEELTIEDTLTRALFAKEITGSGPAITDQARGGWMLYTLHRCGKQLCKMTDYEVKGKVSLVAWDRREGGSVETVPWTRAELKQRAQCMQKIGFPSRNACKTDCWDRFGRLGSVGWEAQNQCEQMCFRGCPE